MGVSVWALTNTVHWSVFIIRLCHKRIHTGYTYTANRYPTLSTSSNGAFNIACSHGTVSIPDCSENAFVMVLSSSHFAQRVTLFGIIKNGYYVVTGCSFHVSHPTAYRLRKWGVGEAEHQPTQFWWTTLAILQTKLEDGGSCWSHLVARGDTQKLRRKHCIQERAFRVTGWGRSPTKPIPGYFDSYFPKSCHLSFMIKTPPTKDTESQNSLIPEALRQYKTKGIRHQAQQTEQCETTVSNRQKPTA